MAGLRGVSSRGYSESFTGGLLTHLRRLRWSLWVRSRGFAPRVQGSPVGPGSFDRAKQDEDGPAVQLRSPP